MFFDTPTPASAVLWSALLAGVGSPPYLPTLT